MASIRYCLPDDLKGTILESIVNAKLRELTETTRRLPAAAIEAVLDRAPQVRPFKRALERVDPAVIAEIKRASPSAGILRRDFDPLQVAGEYEAAGAAAISVITEVAHFQGGLEILAGLRWHTRVPLLRKDFIVDSYQVLEARHAGADAVLLIAALLRGGALRRLREGAEELGMDALVEVHSEQELDRALDAGASLIGVNNRDLTTFRVSLDTSVRLAPRIPAHVTAVAESGIRSREDISRLARSGYRGFLVGESLVRAESPGRELMKLTAAQTGTGSRHG